MGRRKIEMKTIEDQTSRQVTFSKRRSGLFNKARELSHLCDADLALLIFSPHGRLFHFSPSSSLSEVLERYQKHSEMRGHTSTNIEETEDLQSDYVSIQTCTELLHTVDRNLNGPNADQLSLDDFMQLEKQLDDALRQTRVRKERKMIEENGLLERKVAASRDSDPNATKERVRCNSPDSRGGIEYKKQTVSDNEALYQRN